MGKLSYQDRKNLPSKSFIFPGKAPGGGSYPIPDVSHARNALARSSGKPQEGTVRAAVDKKYPQLKKNKKKAKKGPMGALNTLLGK